MSLASFFRTAAHTALELLSPSSCAACDVGLDDSHVERPFCGSCELGVAPRDPSGCAACDSATSGDGLCHRCHRRLFPLLRVHAAFDYEGPIAAAIQRLKYESRDDLAAPLARRWAEELRTSVGPDIDLICPVPLHPRRVASRGFDQSWLLASALAREFKLPTTARALRRARATRPQVGLGLSAREANVRSAFEGSPVVAGRRLLLIDDVLTTGATLRACADAALAAGASAVSAFVLARAQP